MYFKFSLCECIKPALFFIIFNVKFCLNIFCVIEKGSVILMNYHFTTTKVHFKLAGGKVLELYIDKALNTKSRRPFKGNMDIEKLRKAIKKYRENTLRQNGDDY